MSENQKKTDLETHFQNGRKRALVMASIIVVFIVAIFLVTIFKLGPSIVNRPF